MKNIGPLNSGPPGGGGAGFLARGFHWLARAGLLAAAYFISGRLALLLAVPPGCAPAVWPAAGIALAGILLGGARLWPGIWLGSFLVNLWAFGGAAGGAGAAKSVLLAAGLGGGAAGQALLGAWLVRRAARFPTQLVEAREIILFLVWGGPMACLAGATWAVTLLAAAGAVRPVNYFFSWCTWWVGDTVGVILFAPLIFIWLNAEKPVDRRRGMAVCLPGALLFALTICLFIYAGGREQNRLAQVFERRTDSLAGALKSSLDRHLEVLEFFATYYASAGEVGRQGFRTFAEQSLRRNPGLVALAWDVRVTDAQRDAFEARMRRDGNRGFQITEQNAQGELVRARRRADHVAVTFIEPPPKPDGLGFDVESEKIGRAALEKADVTGRATATPTIQLVPGQQLEPGFLVFRPDSAGGKNNKSYLAGLFRLREMVDVALRGLPQEGIKIQFFDETAPRADELIYEVIAPGKGASPAAAWMMPADKMLLFERIVPVALAGREWSLHFSATPDSFAMHRSLAAWSVLAGGLLFTALLGAFLLVVTGRTVSVERGVAERTEELRTANLNLRQQVAERERAEQSLAQERNLLATLVNVLPDLVYIKNRASQFLVANRAQIQMVGKSSAKELLGRTDADFFPPEKAAEYLASEQAVLQRGHSIIGRDEQVLDVPTGGYRWISTTKVPLRDAAGQINGLVGLGRDVTQKKLDELAHQRLVAAMEGAMDGLAVLDAATRFVYVNAAHVKLFGYDRPEELLGQPWKILHDPEELRRIEQDIFPLLATQKHWAGEVIGRRRGGLQFFEGLSLTRFGADGLICVCRDISEVKRVQAELKQLNEHLELRVRQRTAELEKANGELRASHERFERAVRGTNDGIWDWNIATNEDYFSDRWCELLGYGLDELPKTFDSWFRHLHAADRPRAVEAIRQHFEERKPYDLEYRLRHKSGEYRWFRARGQATWDAAGKPCRMAGSISDITGRKQAEAELLHHQNQLQELAAQLLVTEEAERRRIAVEIHDQLGQTLAACRLQLGVLCQALPPPAAAGGLRQLLDDAIRQARSLTFELSPPVLHELGLEPALQWLLEKYQSQHGWEVRLVSDGAAGALPEKSRVLLFRIVRELLANAAKHARAEKVFIALRQSGPDLEIEVGDNGIGFDLARADVARDGSGGFGLFSIRDRLHHVGGRFEVDSVAGATRVLVAVPVLGQNPKKS